MKKFLRILGRFVSIVPAIALQVAWYWLLVYLIFLSELWILIAILLVVLQFLAVLYLVSIRMESNYRLLWIVFILSLPYIGVFFYLISGNRSTSKPIEKRITKNYQELAYKPSQENEECDNRTINMVSNISKMPIVKCDEAKYYPLGDDMFPDMLEDLKKAKHFIFMEYFIIEKGRFWNSIVEILEQKVKEGVTVKVLYDDVGSIATYSISSRMKLRKAGIDIVSFNKATGVHIVLNNRDHRKMTIIDNEVCYSGGVNIADEYINEKLVYGHWKDIGFRVTGETVYMYTHMFTLFHNAYSKDKIIEKDLYRPETLVNSSEHISISYYDSPSNEQAISNSYVINLLSTAKKYVYIYSPYFILNDSLREAFIRAAQNGIDVRVIIPGIPDKKIPYSLALAYAEELAYYGVKIYKYTPGFVHAKATVSDDEICSIGTVNMDYRSLYLHYENNTIFTNNMIQEVKNDFLKTQEKCELVVYKKRGFFHYLKLGLQNLFGPLM